MNRTGQFWVTLFSAAMLVGTIDRLWAAEYFVAPDGRAENPGTEAAPWDIASALGGGQPVESGDTIWLRGGRYRYPDRSGGATGYMLRLQGAQGRPIHVRALPGERVTIDGRVNVVTPSEYLWMWDLEITVSEVQGIDREVHQTGSHPQLDVIPGGLDITGGRNSKFINLVVHDNLSSGVGFWRTASNAELHGCIIYDNGWIAPDRYHGPGIYTQNEAGEKYITDNILFGNYSTTIQAYGSSRAWVDHFRIVGNVAFAPRKTGGRERILVGGGRPSADILVSENICYEVPIQIGYGDAGREGKDITVTDNLVIRSGLSIAAADEEVTRRGNTLWNEGDPRPDQAQVILRRNKYDANRANLVIINWSGEDSVEVDLREFLQQGQPFHIQSVLDYYGPPVAAGRFTGVSIAVPIARNGRTGGGEFCAYVVFRGRSEPAGYPKRRGP